MRDRIIGLERIAVQRLRPHPRNWRTHPPAQEQALRDVLGSIGWAGALIVRKAPGEDAYQILDGHLRAEVSGEEAIPCLVVDVDDAEADTLLATLDPLSAMAGRDAGALQALLALIDAGERDGLGDLLARLRAETDAILTAPPLNGFPEVGDSLPTEYRCPACGHEWSGRSKP